nr:PepSY domain-containing protein [Corynebacterium lowii]
MAAFILRLHFYAGMAVGPFVLVAALTGAAYAVAPTLESMVYRDLITVDAVDAPMPLSEQVAAAQRDHPGLEVSQVWPAQEQTDSTRVLFTDPANPDDNPLAVFVDPADGGILGAEPTYSGLGELPLRRWISELHESLHLGDPGEVYSELAASWLWVIALGGVWLWWRRVHTARLRARRDGATTRPRMLGGIPGAPAGRRGARRRAMNLHAVTGAWLFVAVLGLSATGITWSHFAGQNVDSMVTAMKWKATPIETDLGAQGGEAGGAHAGHEGHGGAEPEGTPVSADTVSSQIERVIATARQQHLTGELIARVPSEQGKAWQVSERWVPWRLTSDAVSINGSTGGLVDRQDFADLPLFSKLRAWGIYLHMGIMFGLPLQIVLFVVGLGIALITVQGYRMWWCRRPTRGSRSLAGVPGLPAGLTRDALSVYAMAAMFALTVGVFLPTVGVSLAAFVLLDAVLALRAGSRNRRTCSASISSDSVRGQQ